MKENPFKVGQEVSDDLKKVILEKDTFGSDTEWYCHRNAKVPNSAEASAMYRKYVFTDPRYDLWEYLDANGFKLPLDDDLNSVIHYALRAADDDSLRLAGLVRVEKANP